MQPCRDRRYLEDRIASIRGTRGEIDRLFEEVRLATPRTFFEGALAIAALIGAGAALDVLLF